MRNFPWLKNRSDLCKRFVTISRLAQEGRFEDVLAATKEAEAACALSGVPATPFLLWSRAVAEDQCGNLSAALEFILLAVRADPIDGSINTSLEIIAGKAREKLMADPWDEADAGIYAALAGEELVDDGLRVAYSNFLLSAGKFAEALRVSSAVATLNPRNVAAWGVVEACAEKMGDIALATEAANSGAAAKVAVAPLKPNVACARA